MSDPESGRPIHWTIKSQFKTDSEHHSVVKFLVVVQVLVQTKNILAVTF